MSVMRIAQLLSPLQPPDPTQPNHRAGRVPIFHFTLNHYPQQPNRLLAEFASLQHLAEACSWGPADDEPVNVKPKRKRASLAQLTVLKQVFQQTPFPTTELRRRLAKSLGMTVRSVQIWFQNQRQSARGLMQRKQGREVLPAKSSSDSFSPSNSFADTESSDSLKSPAS